MDLPRWMLVLVTSAAIAASPAPAAATTSFMVRWTAPASDGPTRRVSGYDLRYSVLPLTEMNFHQATKIVGLPSPAVAGSPESLVVSGLPDGVVLYLAIKSTNLAGNPSPLSNVAIRPAQPTDFDPSTLSVSFSLPWPNPARQSARWNYSQPHAARVQVDVFDVVGRHVRTLATGERSAGRGELSWDLRGDGGRPVPAGLYLVRARIGSREWTNRLIVVR